MEVIDHMDVPRKHLGVTIGELFLHQTEGRPPPPTTSQVVHEDRDDDFGEEQYMLLNQIEVDDHGAVTRAWSKVYGYGLYSRVVTYATTGLGQVRGFTDRPRIKREYRMSYRSCCPKGDDWRDPIEGKSFICEQEPTTQANRQKCAGDKPRYRTGRRMARRELNMMEVAMCTG